MKTIRATPALLAECLEWAMEHVSEKYDCAAGIGCIHCSGGVLRENYKGLTTDPVEHDDDCPWLRAKLVLDLYKIGKIHRRAKRESKGCDA